MGKTYFSADLHNGEQPTPNTHSFLRPGNTNELVLQWIKQCQQTLKPEDTLVLVGDLAIQLADLDVYAQLPACRKILVLGDKEYANKNFSREECLAKLASMGTFDSIVAYTTVTIGDVEFFVSHKPTDCFNQPLPAICGHIHGIWRTQKMNNSQPIINVGADAWGFQLVSEEYLMHQYTAVSKGYYDNNCFINL